MNNIVNVQQIEADTSQGGCSGAEGAPDAPRYVVNGEGLGTVIYVLVKQVFGNGLTSWKMGWIIKPAFGRHFKCIKRKYTEQIAHKTT